jgi:hypothetical protein
MLMPLLVLIVILVLFGGLGFLAHALWYVLIAALILWILGFLLRVAGGSRWYLW